MTRDTADRAPQARGSGIPAAPSVVQDSRGTRPDPQACARQGPGLAGEGTRYQEGMGRYSGDQQLDSHFSLLQLHAAWRLGAPTWTLCFRAFIGQQACCD